MVSGGKLAWLGMLGAGLLHPAAQAQDEDDVVVENALEEVIVTGSRIARRDFTSASPLVTISKDDLEFSGQPTLEEYLNQMPQLQPGNSRSRNNGSDGTAALDLRGLGPGRTLVMLNGRRVAPSGVGSAIDVNNIPSVLVERVEIITGGASTVYGSDAIAGVVNFLTRSDFEGLSFEGNYNVTRHGDADIWDFNAVYGFNFENGGNLTAYAGRYEREALFAGEREISRLVLFQDWDTGTIEEGGSGDAPSTLVRSPRTDLGNGPVNITFNPDGTPRAFDNPGDLYNYAPINYIQTPLERDTVGVMGHLPLGGRFEGYFELSWARNVATLQLAEIPFRGIAVVNIDNPVLAPETQALFARPEFSRGTGFATLSVGRRITEIGPRIVEYDRDYQRYLGGIRGELGGDWQLDAWFTYTDADEEENLYNDGSFSRISQGFLVDPATGQCFDPSGGCVPVDIFGPGRISPEAIAFIRVDGVSNTTRRQQSLASVVVTGSPFEILDNRFDTAFGVEWRRDEAHFEADELLFTGDTLGFRGAAPIDGTETVLELFTEAVLTLFEDNASARQLDIEAGLRWSDYDNAGSVTTWKAGFNWQATDTVGFRAMYQHAVRAPNNAELFTQQYTEQGAFQTLNYTDPCSASADPVGNGNTDKCVIQGLPASQVGVFEATDFYPTDYILGGNPELVPESSDTLTFGLVLTPDFLDDLVVSIDYWNLEVEDTIGQIAPDLICFDPLNTSGLFCENLQRDATGNVARYVSLTENRGLLATDGIDIQVQYARDLPASWALSDGVPQLAINATFSHVFSLENQENPVTEVYQCAGFFGWPCSDIFGSGSFAENKMLTTFNYGSGPYTLHLTWRWIDGMDSAVPKGSWVFGYDDPLLAIPEVSAYSYFDLGFAWNWQDRLITRFGVNNLLDKEPPLMADSGPDFNTDALLYDVYGRTYYLNMRFQATGH